MEKNTLETEFLRETEELSAMNRTKKIGNIKLLILWIALGVASVSFLLGKFFSN